MLNGNAVKFRNGRAAVSVRPELIWNPRGFCATVRIGREGCLSVGCKSENLPVKLLAVFVPA